MVTGWRRNPRRFKPVKWWTKQFLKPNHLVNHVPLYLVPSGYKGICGEHFWQVLVFPWWCIHFFTPHCSTKWNFEGEILCAVRCGAAHSLLSSVVRFAVAEKLLRCRRVRIVDRLRSLEYKLIAVEDLTLNALKLYSTVRGRLLALQVSSVRPY